MMKAKITPSLWFDDNAEEAMNYYVSVFPNSEITRIERYPDEKLDEHFVGQAGKIINGEFILNGEKFICLDGGPLFKFNEAISFTVTCKDQAEIDSYWAKLSHVPEAEQCGWCKDKFGLSWQIIPENLGELLAQSDKAIQILMQQKKIIIKEFENQ
ncbi:VOC family protein [Lactococcus kimchii]|uniref:VOC family protein n=1 Tax=Lactococcus sp. S-13 TaxID=2507158 RepID=UPI001CC1DB00|nr:VOC family protein [Lactococcus sp. S-13]